MAMLAAHLSEDPVPPSVRSGLPIPQAIDALVLSLLARDPEGRPASARALLARVAAIECALGLSWTDADAEAWWQANMPDAIRPRSALVL
jgi:serine/threonine-protein kinase